jgi:CBS-domain-containing membrane protein
MKLWRVDDVMTTDVVAVREQTPYREVVNVLIGRRISAVPVLDRFDQVVGVVSEADLLHKVQAAGEAKSRMFWSRHQRAERVKALGRTAADVMTSPALSVLPSLAVAAAARRMQSGQVKRLPVVDDLGRLVGIVTRSDLLKVHLRSDAEIRHDVVEEVFRQILSLEPGQIQATTTDGVVKLSGRTHFRSTADKALRLTGQVPGVVGVVDELSYDLDDRLAVGSETGAPFGVA